VTAFWAALRLAMSKIFSKQLFLNDIFSSRTKKFASPSHAAL
jgi:hypothetical protein